MKPSFTWLDLTSQDRDKMRRVMDLLKEEGTVDEMGLGTLRDTISDALFPGTSVLHTRLRYVLFIPWMYQEFERKRLAGNAIEEKGRDYEISLISALGNSDDSEGTIGSRAKATLSRLPSSAYWAALVRWGLFRHEQSQGWYHRHFSELVRRSRESGRADDPGVVWGREPNWHPRLPPAPAGFPGEASFALTREEAAFIQGRIEERCHGSLFAWLSKEDAVQFADHLWDEPAVGVANIKIQQVVEWARRFSLHVEGLPLFYNLLLAERKRDEHQGDTDLIERYRAEAQRWIQEELQESPFDTKGFENFMILRGRSISTPQSRFLNAWADRVRLCGESLVDDRNVRDLIERRERQLKGHRARLFNSVRLQQWDGGVGVGRMEFRWSSVRQLLKDLHQGLAN
ncbi:DUF6361 family protein [Abyssibacter profundi]|uniref:Uncharacterized protein n=1 Tax=Abyssibacter profundi TaxID=2182787 RepID=A0A383XQG6_9GAMM|nr:DUF6361 family protein [Abyssibacter profundi]PWN54870.1 hypothetical protein DEH80_15310 [Abyssibacter profundi]